MTDKELVERLLDFDKVTVGDARDAALRIEALTEQLEAARTDAKEAEDYAEELEKEREARHANPADFRYWEGRYRDEKARVDELEKELNICRMAQVVMENGIAEVEGEFARAMKHVMDYSNDRHLVTFARDTLAKIEGKKDE